MPCLRTRIADGKRCGRRFLRRRKLHLRKALLGFKNWKLDPGTRGIDRHRGKLGRWPGDRPVVAGDREAQSRACRNGLGNLVQFHRHIIKLLRLQGRGLLMAFAMRKVEKAIGYAFHRAICMNGVEAHGHLGLRLVCCDAQAHVGAAHDGERLLQHRPIEAD